MTTAGAALKVSGLVQGVGFRYYCLRKARNYGLTGWIKNELDGSVTLLVEGDRGPIEAIIEEIKAGPPSSSVTDVVVTWRKYTGKHPKFEISF